MGAAAGAPASDGDGGGLLHLACTRGRCTSCSTSGSKSQRYEKLPPSDLQDLARPASYHPLLRNPCEAGDSDGSQLWKICRFALLATVLAVLTIVGTALLLGACARAGDETCGKEFSGWARWSLGLRGAQARHAQDEPSASSADSSLGRGGGRSVHALSAWATVTTTAVDQNSDTGGDADSDEPAGAGGASTTTAGLAGGASTTTAVVEPRSEEGSGQAGAADKEAEEVHTSCGPAEDNMCYILPEVYRVASVPSAEECCRKCQTFPDGKCLAWTWGRDCAGDCNQTCILKGASNYRDEHVTKVLQPGVVSAHFQPKTEEVPMLALKAWPDTLYCFALVRPESEEPGLIRLQHERGWGIFQCEGRSFYSSKVFQIAKGVKTTKIDSDLECEVGGEFGTALNSWIFIEVWKKVISDATFAHHDWTVKVDPDAAWFPDRLRIRLQEHRETSNGVYLNNCRFGLHGPLEVLSKKAVSVYATDLRSGDNAICVQQQEFGGWGEDMFMDQCLLRHLMVERDNDFTLLCEDHCDCPEWKSCSDGSRVAFHPFKTEEDFRKCMANASKGRHAAS